MGALALAMAMLGGAALLAMMALTVVGVAGRALVPLGMGPAPGDFEPGEVGAGFAVAAFLPWRQHRRGHVTVDILLARVGARLKAWVDVAANLLMTRAAVLIAWRMGMGLADRLGSAFYVETSFILPFPVWCSGATVSALARLWTAIGGLCEAGG